MAVNHRLGALGSAHLDIVAALEWVKENVSHFGGDPSRVLVYGQSGGGAKTSTLLAMPAAEGLVHSASVMSGAVLKAGRSEHAAQMHQNS